jgi:hypothetical protein
MIPNLNNLDVLKSPSATTEANALPGILAEKSTTSSAYDNMRVRYQKLDLNEMVDISELEKIETRALRGQGVYILSRKDFVFMDKMFMLIGYIEEDQSASKPQPDVLGKPLERKGGTTEALSFNPKPASQPAPEPESEPEPTGPSLAPWEDDPSIQPTPIKVELTPEQALAAAMKYQV